MNKTFIEPEEIFAQEDIPIPDIEGYLKDSAKTEQLYSIGLFDILGFSNFVEHNGAQAILDLYQRLVDLIYQQQSSMQGESCITGVAPVPLSPDYKHGFYFAQANGFVNVVHFSDTFIIYVNYDIKAPSFQLRDSKYEPYPLFQNEDGAAIPVNFIRHQSIFPSFLQTCMEFFCSALTAGIPLRGCISTGMATMDIVIQSFTILSARRIISTKNRILGFHRINMLSLYTCFYTLSVCFSNYFYNIPYRWYSVFLRKRDSNLNSQENSIP